ncbi:hypothetical protein VPLG_00075 [Vibrio phage eugene 12A10]|uniref:hypothetical protein n=1 Tax=Vibrio phage eugene 12A10 TaxID=573172 RepID=UPI000351A275|nr:hypothetical protein VPLG_00075 [Vibrio phage eugene 12A10]AGN51514.1 hypothetical protein VPLG_00075 [Vibrio phage eugene 12A10]
MVPESEWTKGQRDFIGTQFTTPKGSVLTVTGLLFGGKHARFSVECSVCSKDTELFPDGVFSSQKGNLVNKDGSLKSTPCGCARRDKDGLTPTQRNFIGTTFEVEKTGTTLTVTGVSGKDRSEKVLFSVKCSVCSLDTELFPDGVFSSNKSNLVSKGGSLHKIPCGCGKTKWTKEQHEIVTQRLLDTSQHNLKVVGSEKSKGKDRKFILECDVCSKDKELWPLGSITSFKGCLVKNRIPCGCGGKTNWSEAQYKIKVQRECSQRGYVFHGWGGKYKGAHTTLDLSNPKTGNRWQSTSIDSFLSRGSGDPEEAKQRQKESGVFYGYYPQRTKEQDNLYVIRFKRDGTIKVGRAFCIENRLYGSRGLLQQSNHQLQDIEILYIMAGAHQEVYDTEQWVHEELTERGFHASWISWTEECFTEDSEDMIYRLLDESGLVGGEW